MDGIEIFKLFGSIFVDTDEANKSISKTGKEADGLGGKLGKGIKTAGKWAAAITTAAVGIATAAFAMTNKVTSAFDDISKTSQKMGITTDYYQEMDYWAQQNGISSGNMEKALGRLNQRMGLAAEGNEKYSNALTKLGVDMNAVEDGTVSTEDAMTQAIKTLSEMDNEQQKVALASELFGTKLSRELMPALQDGSMSIEEAKEKAKELGLVIGEDTIDAGVKFQDNLTDMKASLGAITQNIMAELIPVFNNMMDWILEHMPQIQEVFSFVFDLISESVSTVIGLIGSLIEWLATLYVENEELLMGIWETIENVFMIIMEFLEEAWLMIKELWDEHGEAIVESAITAFNTIIDVITTALGVVWEVIQSVLGLVWPFIQKTLNKIFVFWDDHGKKIMKSVENAFNFIKGIIEFLMPVITGIIEGAWGIISGTIGGALDIIMGLVSTFSSLLTGDWKGLWSGLSDTAVSIMKTLGTLIKAPINGIISLVNGLIGALNKISIPIPKIPDWIPGIGGKGGGDIGFNIPEIPSLATGGVVHDPTLAMIGDAGAGNPEIVTPEKMMRSIFAEGLQDHGGYNRNTNSMLSVVIAKLEELIKAIIKGSVIVLDDGTLVGRMEPKITEIQNRNKEVWERFKT